MKKQQVGYDTYEELLENETNGWVVSSIMSKGKQTWSFTEGPFVDIKDAKNLAARIRRMHKKESDLYPDTKATIQVRPLWKPQR